MRGVPVSAPAALRLLAGAGAGVALWTSLPPLSWWWAAPLAVAAVAAVASELTPRAALLFGYAVGLGQLVPTFAFLRGIGVDAWLVVATVYSLWFALLGLGLALVGRRRWWPVATPFVWVAVEFARDRWPFGGLPWGRIAFGQADGPLLPWAAVGGAPLVTFAVVTVGAALAAGGLLAVRRRGPSVPAVAAVLAVGVALLGGGWLVQVPTGGDGTRGPAHVVVAAIQGNVPRLGLKEFAQRRAVTANHSAQTLALAADVAAGRVARPDLVVWPENASDDDPTTDPVAGAMVSRAVAAVGVPVLVGAVLDGPGPDHVSNAAVVWSPATGPGERYLKRHLVPFGEYLPWRSVLTKLVHRFSLISKDFAAGHRPGVLRVGPATIADVICFEVADDGVVRDAVRGGGRLLVVQTNNATYEHRGDDGRGGETAQQLEMSRLRAVEHGRAVVVVATSGVSAVIRPDGRVVARTGVFVPARLVAAVPLRDGTTLADRLGAWPERVAALAGLLAVAGAVWPRRRQTVGAPAGSAGVPGQPAPEPDATVTLVEPKP
ncbi:MAG: apolipoprotein N-acyltransferase [Frankiaceae bacterium]|jgi:apolipoprotein N-acyltransferase|nr:apolipoprotein N-acyltransferase [Frankiaceae bacterium]